MPPPATIRKLTPADLPAALRLSRAAGWNQTPDDWRRAMELAPEGCFARVQSDRFAGTVTTCTFGDVGWVGMMLVDETCRRQGHGKALMQHALQHLDANNVTSIWLDATELGRPLYELLGFSAVGAITRFAGRFSTKREPAADASGRQVSPLHQAATSQLLSFDARMVGVDRARLLQTHCNRADKPVVVLQSADASITGYCSHRPGRLAAQIGPAAARTEAELLALLHCVLSEQAGDVFVDVADKMPEVSAWLESHGITPARRFTRMCRGDIARGLPPATSAWLSSGPEKG